MFRTLLIVAAVSLFQSCFRVIPVQLTRSPQLEFYKQFYDFGNDSTEAVRITEHLMGKNAILLFTEKYNKTRQQFFDAIRAKKLYVTGAFNFVIYLSPSKLDSFFINAIGRYALVWKQEDEQERILFTADFQVKDNGYSIDNDLKKVDKDSLRLRTTVSQFLTRHFYFDQEEKGDFLIGDIPLRFDLIMERVNDNNNLYRIKYMNGAQPHKHPVYYNDTQIGYMQFDNLRHNDLKILDLRGRSFVRKL